MTLRLRWVLLQEQEDERQHQQDGDGKHAEGGVAGDRRGGGHEERAQNARGLAEDVVEAVGASPVGIAAFETSEIPLFFFSIYSFISFLLNRPSYPVPCIESSSSFGIFALRAN